MKDVTIPLEIVEHHNFDLVEIGAMVVAYAFPSLNDGSKKLWLDDQSFQYHLWKLKDQKIISTEGDKMTINLERPFWEIEDYDAFDNPIYSSPSPYGHDENVPMYWRVKPQLVDLKVVWVNSSDEELKDKNSEESFDSLEEAEVYFKEENEKIRKFIKNDREKLQERLRGIRNDEI